MASVLINRYLIFFPDDAVVRNLLPKFENIGDAGDSFI